MLKGAVGFLFFLCPCFYGYLLLCKFLLFPYFLQFFLLLKTVKISEGCSDFSLMVTGNKKSSPSWKIEITPVDDEGFQYKCSLLLKKDKLTLTSELVYTDKIEAESAAKEAISRFQ